MTYLVVCLTAFTASGLTLFSGFGLGTLLLPAFALFFPVAAAVALTALVHFANNFFKLFLLLRRADWRMAARFGAPAVVASFGGAKVLVWLSGLAPVGAYEVADRTFHVVPVKLVVAGLMAAFGLLECFPALPVPSVGVPGLVLGGALSGFFGGLSGHQGAFRSAFLIRSGLGKEAFIATGAVIACLVDLTRLAVYGGHFSRVGAGENLPLLLAAAGSAFLGAYAGTRYLEKVTMAAVQRTVGAMLILIAASLGAGLI